ncbi:MAG: KEOPS complex N(6)-L-threonylcarbamoyladenine synthase Kae1 [Sulfolobales archaeon]|nr:KEOPS complex N(6)-L-threonylcarbamoyladenine synthase Kae1 [Sulfolobales archaeon]MDW8082836.1 KEOPS complex N(6)-L-threonylcarbamoyladenine synthase Kae1 [Sulfolobales archaeon]
MVIVLGVESTAHTFGIGIVSDEPRILADSRFNYVPARGGIHPREAADSFIKNAPSVLREALSQAGLSIDSIDVVAVALGPGLGPCLRVGATIARALSIYYSKPLTPVNHAVAHIEIGRMLTDARDPLVVYISGGNTVITAKQGGRYRVFGETLDIALGNFMDALVRELGLAPPYVVGGIHAIDRCSEGGRYVELPYVVKGQDTSYSGLLTAALRAYRSGVRVEDICFSAREVAYSSLVEVAERGLAQLGKTEILLVGGVAASRYLVEKFKALAEYRGVELYVVPPRYAVDNGVMIAWTGMLMFKYGVTIEPENAVVKQRWRLDAVDIYW